MQSKKINIAISLLLFIFGNAGLFIFVPLEHLKNYIILHLLMISVGVIIILFFQTGISFVIILMITLLYGAALSLIAYNKNIFQYEQFELMILYSAYILSIIPFWLIRNVFLQLATEMERRLMEIEQLKKYSSPNQKMLTYPAFMDRAQMIMTGLKRRNEQGYLLKIQLKEKTMTDKAFHEVLQKAVEYTIRDEFDFYMGMDNGALLVFLQNTEATGVDIVQNRLNNHLKKHINLITSPIDYKSVKIDDLPTAMKKVFSVEIGGCNH
ncbi:hypothetical protein [Cytobacillus purgationiresistens]|uniref:ABC-type multidrug transport system fused ATPase/permease subunit n=1 Tax=Cytobacillus purgationiresistens TaxID=863449 RepID=A0ABU0AQ69_9BACI|nr:hypothetical protein [Cytobacillus purgationiresistens]MDQ0273180.1 ABC-type multidrug transport system fused ATPase/permease subunit [Cytobacillus purgationiresistens]